MIDRLIFKAEDFATIALNDRAWKDAARIAQAKFDAWLAAQTPVEGFMLPDHPRIKWVEWFEGEAAHPGATHRARLVAIEKLESQ